MKFFISGFGKLDIDSDVLCIRFFYEEKIHLWKQKFFNIE